jgi:hypothetical protein
VRFVVEDEHGQPLSVGRRTRALPVAIQRALVQRDRTCRFPGCSNHRFVHGHHIEHWANGGATALDNLVLLCSRHHRFVHELGYRVELVDGIPVFTSPRGRPVHAVPPRPTAPDLGFEWIVRQNADLAITPGTNVPLWDGTPIPYADVIGDLSGVDAGRFAYRVSAETASA